MGRGVEGRLVVVVVVVAVHRRGLLAVVCGVNGGARGAGEVEGSSPLALALDAGHQAFGGAAGDKGAGGITPC